MMNLFRLGGDMLHLVSILILLLKMRSHKSCAGISLKTQIMYVLVFTTRYLDLFTNHYSLYNTVMKIIFLGTTYTIVYLMSTKYRASYDRENDTFRTIFLIAPSFVLGLMFGYKKTYFDSLFEILWSFSIFLESVAILPQIFLLQRTGEVENLTSDYIFALGSYRALYLLNWIYKAIHDDTGTDWIVWIAGIIQTALYCDFFYYYLTSKWYGRKLTLPR
eukprot:TRINITY_DN2810_c0_g1_i1.p1 TRINITY_DN2810_c0_g1~~TRINITY_DN2810_c0_g1_i1.p1  ORF type:complete len:219 (+),score=23.46 TRINITY_DN2810_c0_g1_i1:125-781(+)